MSSSSRNIVKISPSGLGPFGVVAAIGDHKLLADEPERVGGQNTGPDPYELVMAGLGACTSMTVRMYAERKSWPLEKVEVEVRHVESLGADGIKADRFERILRLSGPLSAEQTARLLEIADRCPVSRTLQRGATVTVAEAEAV
jgi:putative redox protein